MKFSKGTKGFLAGVFLTAVTSCVLQDPDEKLLDGVMDVIQDNHVDGKNATSGRKATVDAINGILNGLDPHSRYLTAEENQAEKERDAGAFGGIGISFEPEGKFIRVTETIEGGPSERAGVKADDIITHVNGQSLENLELNEVIQKLRGNPGENVNVTVSRQDSASPVAITITRAIIQNKQVKFDVIGNDIGYIRLSGFNNNNASDEIQEAVEKIQARLGNNVTGYVLDLRNNPGGLMVEAVQIADHFLDAGKVVVTSRGRTRENNYQFITGIAGDITGNKPLIVLMNGGSASASELVAGALQDYKRARILGTRSFGKGSVQSGFELKNGDALWLTTALYYTPGGRSVQNVGITPDILFVPKGEHAAATHLNEAALPNTLQPQPGTAHEAVARENCTAQTDIPVRGLSELLVLPNKKADEMLLCAIDNLRGTSQYTRTQVAPKGP